MYRIYTVVLQGGVPDTILLMNDPRVQAVFKHLGKIHRTIVQEVLGLEQRAKEYGIYLIWPVSIMALSNMTNYYNKSI